MFPDIVRWSNPGKPHQCNTVNLNYWPYSDFTSFAPSTPFLFWAPTLHLVVMSPRPPAVWNRYSAFPRPQWLWRFRSVLVSCFVDCPSMWLVWLEWGHMFWAGVSQRCYCVLVSAFYQGCHWVNLSFYWWSWPCSLKGVSVGFLHCQVTIFPYVVIKYLVGNIFEAMQIPEQGF